MCVPVPVLSCCYRWWLRSEPPAAATRAGRASGQPQAYASWHLSAAFFGRRLLGRPSSRLPSWRRFLGPGPSWPLPSWRCAFLTAFFTPPSWRWPSCAAFLTRLLHRGLLGGGFLGDLLGRPSSRRPSCRRPSSSGWRLPSWHRRWRPRASSWRSATVFLTALLAFSVRLATAFLALATVAFTDFSADFAAFFAFATVALAVLATASPISDALSLHAFSGIGQRGRHSISIAHEALLWGIGWWVLQRDPIPACGVRAA